jgi:hypothetical protein
MTRTTSGQTIDFTPANGNTNGSVTEVTALINQAKIADRLLGGFGATGRFLHDEGSWGATGPNPPGNHDHDHDSGELLASDLTKIGSLMDALRTGSSFSGGAESPLVTGIGAVFGDLGDSSGHGLKDLLKPDTTEKH